MAKTGFKAYAVYLFVKNLHFKDNDFNVMRLKKTPMKDKLINSWNKKRRLQDGLKFQAIEEKSGNIKSLALLFASYYMVNNDFYIQQMFNDNFGTYQKNLAELRQLESVFTNDLKSVIIYCREEKLKVRDLLVGLGSIPKIFKMDLSWNTLVILNDLFGIVELNADLQVNSLEKERWLSSKIKLKNYKPIIQDYLNRNNWKEIAQEILQY
jgi:hypothetical protein